MNLFTLNEYQQQAMSFRLESADEYYALFNLPGEVGELMSLEAKLIRDGGDVNKHIENVTKELGDIMWCVAAIAHDYGLSLEKIADKNIQKLESRKARNTLTGHGDDR